MYLTCGYGGKVGKHCSNWQADTSSEKNKQKPNPSYAFKWNTGKPLKVQIIYEHLYLPKVHLKPLPTVSLLKLLEGPLALGGSLGEQTYKLPEGCSNIYPWTAFPSQLYSCNIINRFVFLLTTTVCFHCCLNEVPQIRVHTHQIHTSIQVPLTN